MSLFRGRVGALLLTVSLAACADSKDSPVAPTAPAFVVTAMSPTSGDISGGTSVILSGFGFTEGTTVTFGGMPGTDVRVISGTLLQAMAPAHVAGEVDVVVANPDGRSTKPSMRYRYVDGTDGCAGCWDY
jgi:IPT/TIG domain